MHSTRLQKLQEFLLNEPDDPFLKYAIATEYLNAGEHVKALGFYEDLILNHADYVGTYYHLGGLYEKLERKPEAIAIYKKGMEVARKLRDMHAFSELQTVYNSAAGLDYDDD